MDPFGEIREEKPLGESHQPPSSEPVLGPSQPSAQSTLDDLLGGSAASVGGGHADDLLGEFLTATAPPSETINRAATEPILPPMQTEQHDEEESQPERIQFESGIDLSDIMSKKTEPEEQHIPKAKEHLEDVYAAALSKPKVEEPEEEEMDFRPLPPEPEGHESNEDEEEEELSQEQPPPVIRQSEPNIADSTPSSAAPAKSARAADDEIAACDLSGLCSWFSSESLPPAVGQLVYWRDPKKSGLVFGGVLLVLLSLSIFSLISVVAYTSLLTLCGAIVFRVYKSILQAVQKTDDGHPFKTLLEAEITLTEEKVQEVASVTVSHVNCTLNELRRLFLVEDLVDSIKFGVLLWVFTYVGAWFNGMTLIILGFIGAFTLPKVYENNQAQIDQYLDIVRSKMADVSNKVKAAIPLGKKDKEQ